MQRISIKDKSKFGVSIEGFEVQGISPAQKSLESKNENKIKPETEIPLQDGA